MIRRIALLVALGALLALPLPASAGGSGFIVNINGTQRSFSPSTLTIGLSSTVDWSNNSSSLHHTSTADLFDLWDIDLPVGSNPPSIPFQRAGTFAYHCDIHGGMRGMVKVRMSANATTMVGQDTEIVFATINAPSGFTEQIQKRRVGGTWKLWQTLTGQTVHWVPQKAKTFQFRSRFKEISSGKVTGWSPTLVITVSNP